jgi:DNA-directed RNA polymerase subunit D
MKVTIEDEGEDVMELRLEDSNEAVANTLRRAMMTKVPTLAVQELEISRNESALFDEVLANRVGQVPFTIPENVEEEDTVNIALKQEGPGTVLAEDLVADNDEAEPVNPETVIVDLKEDQGLEFEADATLGRGAEHAKHQGGTVGYEKTGEGEFLFRVESTSGYTNTELVQAAISVVKQELDEFEEALEDL